MSQTLSERTIALVKATLPAVQANDLDIVREMYRRMFENPDIRDLFNQSHHADGGSQSRAVAAAILAYAANIENLAVLGPVVERIAQKHVGLQIRPEHYPHVGAALLGAIKHILGDAATEEVLAAWGEAYGFLADILMGRERDIYRELAETDGGWTGWRDFTVENVRPESNGITSFLLRPTDGRPVIRHKPGQYLTFWFDIPGQRPVKRNYSISAAPNGETYRITVKREPMGLASNWLHENVKPGATLKVAPPAGDFYLPEKPERSVVLLSGGVGLTPMVAMLETIVARHPGLQVQYIHGTLDGHSHAMRDHVRNLASGLANVSVTTFYQVPTGDDIASGHHDQEGLIGEAWLCEATPIGEADYYLCGPRPFLRRYASGLARAGVPSSRIHYEFFGPADEQLAA